MKKVGGGAYVSPSALAQSGVAANTAMKLSEQGEQRRLSSFIHFLAHHTIPKNECS